ncbi:hypothetical protein NK718_02560 [Alsobacter sp. SYSU M60028]|uniref:Uncharacterized protein n=1 Tax=Alsobacter ponti TaxID=2962936 RepID=A0ABT1L7F2_9HYPH|nr:hypothetical protein [Alsobacter ponti]MCP8937384.1 hypothetical protein [Alsobacter ponti]
MQRQLDGLITAVAEGYRAPGLQARLDTLEVEKTQLERTRGPRLPRLSACTPTSPTCTAARWKRCTRP